MLRLDSPEHFILFALACVVAGFTRGFAGFGGPSVLLLILVNFFNPVQLVFKIILIDFLASCHLVPANIRKADWKVVGILTTVTAIAMPIGMYLLHNIDADLLRRAIGIVVGFSAVFIVIGYQFKRRPGNFWLVLVAFLNGIIFGATSILLIAVIFLFALPDKAEATRANIIVWSSIIAIIYVALYFGAQYASFSNLWQITILGVVYSVFAYIGAKAFKRIAEERYRQAALLLLIFLSLVAIWS